MTKKDHKKIAKTINEWLIISISKDGIPDGFINLCEKMANMLEKDNSRFDRNKFLALCNA